MHLHNIEFWKHPHVFGHDQIRPGERKTTLAAALTLVFMGVEIAAGIVFGSMALLADGLHMASHATALGINMFAYHYARRLAHDRSFTFGTGKVNALGGFTGAILLGFFSIWMALESLSRLVKPVPIVFDSALLVAILGLVVNIVSVFILGSDDYSQEHPGYEKGGHHDHNLRSAYLHVLADALTSVLAVGALLAAKYWGFVWADPLIGALGALWVARWGLGLILETSHVLLDKAAPEEIHSNITKAIEKDGDSRISDLHVWAIGPNLYGVIVSVVASNPKDAAQYKQMICSDARLAHVSIEVHKCQDPD